MAIELKINAFWALPTSRLVRYATNGTRLTGRYKQIELFPFSYNEFLMFFNLERNPESFNNNFEGGGFPEFLEEKNDEYLRTLSKKRNYSYLWLN
jgi:predicted AAA+ superfamily ATPase